MKPKRKTLSNLSIFSHIKIATAVSMAAIVITPTQAFASTVAEPTTMNVVLLAIFVFMAVGVSFACSLAESTLLSLTPSYIADVKEKDPKKHKCLKR